MKTPYMYICRRGHIYRSGVRLVFVSCGPCNRRYPKQANQMKLVQRSEKADGNLNPQP